MDVTLTIPDAQAPRLARVIGMQLGLKDRKGDPRSATLAEAKAWLAGYIKSVVRSYELNEAQEQAEANAVDIIIS